MAQQDRNTSAILRAFVELRRAIISFVSFGPSVYLPVWKHSELTGRIFMKGDIWGFIKNLSKNLNLIKIWE